MRALANAAALCIALGLATANAAPLRDPFARPAAPSPVPAAAGTEAAPSVPETPPQLRAIMYAPGRSLANVGGRIVSEGDTVGKYKVVRIEERSVTLLRDRVKSVLAVDKESGK